MANQNVLIENNGVFCIKDDSKLRNLPSIIDLI